MYTGPYVMWGLERIKASETYTVHGNTGVRP